MLRCSSGIHRYFYYLDSSSRIATRSVRLLSCVHCVRIIRRVLIAVRSLHPNPLVPPKWYNDGSVKVFSSLVPALLARNLRIEVWEQEPGSNTRWRLRLSASPGNMEAIMADIYPGQKPQHVAVMSRCCPRRTRVRSCYIIRAALVIVKSICVFCDRFVPSLASCHLQGKERPTQKRTR